MQESKQYEWRDFRDIEKGKCKNRAKEICNHCNNEYCIYNMVDKDHGRVIALKFEAYHDVIIYEDGYEEKYYLGD